MDMNNRTFGGFTDMNQFENQYEVSNPYQRVQKQSDSGRAASVLGSMGSYAGTGASIGTAFGPGIGTGIGAGIGAIVGLGVGLLGDDAEQKKEADLSKAADKYNSQLDEVKFAQMKSRAMTNDIRTASAQNSLATTNLHDYLSDFKNPY